MNRAVAGLTVTAVVFVGCSSGGSTGDPEAFCKGFARLGDQVAAAAEPPEELADVPSASRLADDIATTADALRAAAPDEIAEDTQRLATVTADLARDLRDFYQAIVDDPARANDPTFLTSFEPVSEDRRKVITEAGAEVRPWVAEHCDGAPSPTSTSEDSSSPSKRVPAPIASGFLVVSACGSGGGGADVEAYCDAIRSFQALEEDFSNPDIPADASFEDQMKAMRETFEPLKKRIGEMRDAAPSEIRDDVRELADAAEELLDVFLSADSVEDLTDPQLAERMTKLQQDAEAARDRVADYTKKECGIDLTEDSGD